MKGLAHTNYVLLLGTECFLFSYVAYGKVFVKCNSPTYSFLLKDL